jgi:glyoxylase-like metal-dependent hydrolase (beta-lactamase superfamily II)
MLELSRRRIVVGAAGAAAAFGLTGPLAILSPAGAQGAAGPVKKHKIGSIDVMLIQDGVWNKPHDPAFIKNASVDDTKKALEAGGMASDVVRIPFVVPVAKVGGKTILFDAGTGGQVAPTAGEFGKHLEAEGIKADQVDMVAVSHFHPDHIFGLMAKDTNAAVYPKAELVMPEAEYNWWTDASVFTKLPEARHGLAKRIQAVFGDWKAKGKIKLIGDNAEIAPGIRSIATPGHTSGHTSWHVASGSSQLIIMADVTNVPALFVRNPGWHAVFDADAAQAEATRRKLLDRAIADKAMVTGYHFPMPSAGTIAKDGNGYTLTPAA